MPKADPSMKPGGRDAGRSSSDAWRAARPHALSSSCSRLAAGRCASSSYRCSRKRAALRRGRSSSHRSGTSLGQRDPAKQDEMLSLFERYFDRLLVHGDPRFLPFDRTFR
jgi:hypothetical protein